MRCYPYYFSQFDCLKAHKRVTVVITFGQVNSGVNYGDEIHGSLSLSLFLDFLLQLIR